MPLFLLFLLGYMLSQFYRSFLAVIAPEMAADIGLDASALANIAAAWFAVFALAQFPLGVALDRIGPRRTVPAMMLAAIVGAAMLANARTAWHCILANGLIGLGCSPLLMGGLYVLARTHKPERFGYLVANLIGLGSLGNLLAATPLSYAAGTLGWRGAFMVMALITCAVAILTYWLVEDPPAVSQPDTSGSILAGLGEILAMRQFWPLIPISLFSYGAVLTERGLWIGPWLTQVFGLDALQRGNAALAMAIAMSLGALGYGALDRVEGRRQWLVCGGSLVAASGFVVLWLVPQPNVWTATAIIAVIGFAGLNVPLVTAHARMFFPDRLLGRGITFTNFLMMGGAGLVQWVSGLYVASLQASGMQAANVFAQLHLALGLTIAIPAAIYMRARNAPAK